MPLLKRTPYEIKTWPEDLKPDELLYQVRFTKEVFRDYQEYLNCMNLYRQRLWTCKVSGKTNLTYEEALVSERKATEKVLQFPKEFMGPVLHMVQFSVLRIEELVDRIYKAFKDRYVAGEEVLGIRGDYQFHCRIVRVLSQVGNDSPQYEVTWAEGDGKRGDTTIENCANLMRRKPPFTRALLKAFIKESATCAATRHAPWSVQEKLTRRFKIPLEPPEESEGDENGDEPRQRTDRSKRIKVEESENGVHNTRKRRKREDDQTRAEPQSSKGALVIYPIEDTLIKPSPEDPTFTERPTPSSDFILPVECIGDLLMVWDFCVSFAKPLALSPFSLDEFEKALEYREGEASLLAEIHFALLRAAYSDPSLREEIAKAKRKRKAEPTLNTWKEDVCDVIKVVGSESLRCHAEEILEDSYKQLKSRSKLEILQELVNRAICTSTIRAQLDSYVEEQQLVVIRKKDQGEGKKNKEEQHKSKQAPVECSDDGIDEHKVNGQLDSGEQDGIVGNEANGSVETSDEAEKPTGWQSKRKRKPNGKVLEVTPSPSPEVVEDVMPDIAMSSSKSRHAIVKLKVDKRIAEENERQKRLLQEQKRSQEKRREQAEALAERKLQEQKLAEKQMRKEGSEFDKRSIRTSPLGKDRDHNRYWFFSKEGRVFVESKDSDAWGYYCGKDELDALLGWLNVKGVRETALQQQLETYYAKICTAFQKRAKEQAARLAVEEAALRRSTRVRSAPRPSGFLAYVNRYRSI